MVSRASSVSVAPSLPLDLVTGAAAGYSTRKLRTAYAGSAVNVRRDSDSTNQDIGFTGNSFNVTAFTTFIGAGNGFNADFYDQSGNAANALQATPSNQPGLSQDLVYYGSHTTQGSGSF
jgi:hypothetical protein